MAQNDFLIANDTANAVRLDLQDAFQALATNNSGSSAPSTTYANMWWYETDTNRLKIRNEANTAWINVAYVDQTAGAWRVLDNTQVVSTSGTQTGLIGDQSTATWETGTGTTESLVSPAKVKAAIEANAAVDDLTANDMLQVSAGSNRLKALVPPAANLIGGVGTFIIYQTFTALRSCGVTVSVTASKDGAGSGTVRVYKNASLQTALSFSSETETTKTTNVSLSAGDVISSTYSGSGGGNISISAVDILADNFAFVGV